MTPSSVEEDTSSGGDDMLTAVTPYLYFVVRVAVALFVVWFSSAVTS